MRMLKNATIESSCCVCEHKLVHWFYVKYEDIELLALKTF